MTWSNSDDSPHRSAVARKPPRTGLLLKGQSEALTFAETGTFDYSCALHPNMKRSLEVTR